MPKPVPYIITVQLFIDPDDGDKFVEEAGVQIQVLDPRGALDRGPKPSQARLTGWPR